MCFHVFFRCMESCKSSDLSFWRKFFGNPWVVFALPNARIHGDDVVFNFMDPCKAKIEDLTHIPLEGTPDVSPTVYEGILSFWGFGEVWCIFPGYVGKIIEKRQAPIYIYILYIYTVSISIPWILWTYEKVSYNTANWNPSHVNSPGFDSHLPLTPFRKLCKCLVGKCQLVGFGRLAFRTLHANPKHVTLLKFNETRPWKGRPKPPKGRHSNISLSHHFSGASCLTSAGVVWRKLSLGHSCHEQGLLLTKLIIEILSKTERSCKRECFPCFTHRLFRTLCS